MYICHPESKETQTHLNEIKDNQIQTRDKQGERKRRAGEGKINAKEEQLEAIQKQRRPNTQTKKTSFTDDPGGTDPDLVFLELWFGFGFSASTTH